MTNLNKDNLSQMKYGVFNNKSYFGYSSNVLKSGICKYYRREMFDKFEWCIIEMSLFITGSKQGQALFTNLLNRLRILVMEEIACDVECIHYALRILNRVSAHSIDYHQKYIWRDLILFCEIVKRAKRGRIISYINNWWRNKPRVYDLNMMEDETFQKIKKRFICKGDEEFMGKYAVALYNGFMEKNEEVFRIFTILMYKKDLQGLRWRRKDAVYLYWKIVEHVYIDLCTDEDEKKQIRRDIFDFALKMFFRKQMVERAAFAVWIGFLCLVRDKEEVERFDKNIGDLVEGFKIDTDMYMEQRKSIKIDECFVVKDWHVNRTYGLDVFADSGSVVTNEDLSLLGENGEEYLSYYKEVKRKTALHK